MNIVGKMCYKRGPGCQGPKGIFAGFFIHVLLLIVGGSVWNVFKFGKMC